MEVCPICQTPYGVRKRCYYCHGRPKTGETRQCAQCGNAFYAAAWQIKDTKRNQGTYCSRDCLHKSMEGQSVPWAQPDEKKIRLGYVWVWAPDHPKAHKSRVAEHVLVAERTLGRYLTDAEEVHHLDGDKQNNAPDNLLVVTATEHQKYHPQVKHWITITCQECGKTFEAKPSRAYASDPVNQRKYCSLECRYKSWGRQMHPSKE